jgi:hypothetical protein
MCCLAGMTDPNLAMMSQHPFRESNLHPQQRMDPLLAASSTRDGSAAHMTSIRYLSQECSHK